MPNSFNYLSSFRQPDAAPGSGWILPENSRWSYCGRIVADYISSGYWEFEFSLTEEAIRQKLTRAQIVKDFYAQKA
jgi:hypothetical protein